MIININKAILHILDGNSGITVYSDKELDVTDPNIIAYITGHIEKIYEDPALRPGEFGSNSSFKYHLTEYQTGGEDFVKFSVFIADRIYEAISASDKISSADLLVCECVIHEIPVMCVLKFDNKIGFTHQVVQEDGSVHNEIINHYAILPSQGQRISEFAFINLNDQTIRYKGKKLSVEGESVDLIGEYLLDCIFDISTKESFNAVTKIVKSVAEEYGADTVETTARMKKYVMETAAEEEFIEPAKAAEEIFRESPSMRDSFKEKAFEAQVPEKMEISEYVTKKVSSNIKLVTDSGIEISFPAEYYKDGEHMSILNNPDGTLSIQINNISGLVSK